MRILAGFGPGDTIGPRELRHPLRLLLHIPRRISGEW